jgi:hypothetical protein
MIINKAHGKSVGMNVCVRVMHAFSVSHIWYEKYTPVRSFITSQCSSRNRLVGHVDMNVCVIFLYCSQLLSCFHEKYTLSQFYQGEFLSLFIKELCGGTCTCEYPYLIATFHSLLYFI